MYCRITSFLYVIVTIMISFVNSTDRKCNIEPKESVLGTDYFYIAFYPLAYDENVYQEIWNVSATLNKRLGLLEYFVCNDIEITQKIVLTLLLNKRFILKNGKSNIVTILSHLPLDLTLQIASMVSPFHIIVRILSKGDVRIDPDLYSNVNLGLVNTYSEQVISILRDFDMNNIVFIALIHDESDTAYKSIWKDLLEDDLGLCVERYNVNYNDTKRMKEVIESIQSNEEQNIILCYTSTGEHSERFYNFINISHQLKLSGRNWIWNMYTPSFVTSYNNTVDASDGAIILNGGFNSQYNISKTKSVLEIAKRMTLQLNKKLGKIPLFFFYFYMREYIGTNCYYTNTNSGKLNELKINEKLYRACKRLYTIHDLSNVHWGSRRAVTPVTKCSKRNCPAGYSQIITVLSDTATHGRKYWKCRPCEEGSVKPNDGTGNCKKCSGLMVSNKEKTQCYDPYVNVYLSYNCTKGIVVVVFSAVGSVLNIMIGFTLYKYRTTPIIKSANTRLSAIQQGCHLILFLATPVVFVGEPVLIKCQTRHIIVGLFLTIICSLIFIKTQKLMFIFNTYLRVSKQERYLATMTDLFWTFLFVSLQAFTAIFTLLHTPANVLESLDQKTLVRDMYCNTGGHLNLQLLCCVIIMLIVVVQGLRAWKLPSFFNDSKYITMANLLSILMSACMIPLYYSATNPVTQVFLQVMVILSCNFTLLTVMYGNKVYTVWFKSEKNTSAAFRKKMQEHAKEKINSSLSDRQRSHQSKRN